VKGPATKEELFKLLNVALYSSNGFEESWCEMLLGDAEFKKCVEDAVKFAMERKDPVLAFALLFVHGMKVEDLINNPPPEKEEVQ